MKFTSTAAMFGTLAFLGIHCVSGTALDMRAISDMASREPHPAYIKYPAAGSTYKYSNGAALLPFKMLDGEQTGSEYTVNVYLGGQRIISGLHFDGYVAAKNVTIKSTQFPAGTYTLQADEISIETDTVEASLTESIHLK